MRIEAGTVREDLVLDGTGLVAVAYGRETGGWVAEITVAPPGTASGADLAVVHRLRAPTLAAARRAVPAAAAFLAGAPVQPMVPLG